MPDYSRTRIQFRRGTSSELNAANPILGKGEPAFATDTNSLKVGDGSTAYISLSSISGGGEGGGGLDSVVQDTTPQLGGTLDALSNNISSVGIITATSFVKSSGTSSQFLKADGSIDTSTYLTSISNIDTTNFNSSAIVTESEGISSNDNDTTIPTSAAVKDYVDNSGGASLSQEDVEDYVGDMVDGGTETGISVTYDDDNGKIDFVVASQTDENFTTDDHNKLDGIEAGADVTDTDNVTSAGALMDSEVTNLSQVKAFDSSSYATAAQGTKADSAQQPPSEGAFANGDKTKLDGIETSADVTNTTNVTSAGALMDSEVTNLAQVKVFDSSDYATAAQGSKADTAQQPPSEGAFADGDKTKLNSIEAGADVTDTANVTSAGALMDSELASIANVKALDQSVIAGASPNLITTSMTDASDKRFMTDAQEAKLDSVESNADVTDTANVTSAGALMDSELTSIANVKALDQSVVAGSAPNFLTTNMSDAANKRLMTDAQESKLDSVETSADVTDTTNVVAALSQGTGVSISAGGVISVTPLALTTVQTASDETAHLALTAEEGDVVVRSDENKSYVHNGGSAGTMSDYTLLLTPTDVVLSVAGNTGAVTAAQIKTAYEGESNTNAFTDADHSKLDDIEANADVTDADNVTSAGALMDSEITNLSEVKTFASSDYATAAQGTKADSAQQPLSEGAFQDGDKTKLDGIEADADVTDTANVTAAGALMDSEITNLAQVKAFDSSDYLTSFTEADTLATVTGRGAATTTTSVIPFYYANQAAFPDASTYHGAIAHSHSDGAMYFAHGSAWNMLANTEGGAVFNEGGADVDFRVEGDTDTNLLLVDAGTNRIGIATASPSHKLSITDSTVLGGILVSGGGTPGLSLVDTTDDSSHGVYGSDNGILLVSADITSVGGSSSAIKLGVQNATQATITSAGMGIGTETPSEKLHVDGNIRADDGIGTEQADSTFMTYPGGGLYRTANATKTGYLKITLPQTWLTIMMKMSFDLYEYTTHDFTTFKLAGYMYTSSGGQWINTSASMDSDDTNDVRYYVRFGHDGTYCAIYISKCNAAGTDLAETTTWSYPQAVIRDVHASFSATYGTMDRWADGWDVDFTTTLGTITATKNVGRAYHMHEAGYVFNELGEDVDFRIEGDTDANLLFVDASTDRIGIGTATPGQVLDVTSVTSEIAGFNGQISSGPVASGNYQSLIVESKNGSGAKGVYLKHMCNESSGSSTLSMKNVIRMGEGIISLDDAYTTGLSTTYYPKLQVNTETGAVTFNDTYTFPTADGSANQVLQTDGAGNISFGTVSTTNLDTTNFSAATIVTEAEGISSNDNDTTLPTSAAVKDYVDNNAGGTSDVVDDTTPQLGGALDTNGNNITGTGSINISGDLTTTGNNVAIGSTNYGLEVSSSAATLGSNRLQLLSSETVINQAGASVDFRVEGDTQANLLFCDASTDRIGIGTETPAHKLDVAGMGRFVHADGACGLQVEDTGGSGLHIGDCALGSLGTYAGIKHSNHGSSDYMMISNGITTFLSAVNNGAVILRGGGNDSNSEIQVKDVGAGAVGIIFNEAGADRDIRMEGNTDENLFYVDASTDRIGIGTATPASTLDVNGTLTATTLVKSGGTSSQFLKADGSVDSSTYLTAETNDLSAAVTWTNIPNANITQGSVTQHQAALSITESQISDLQSYLTSVSNINTTNFSAATIVTEAEGIGSNDNDTTLPTSAAVKDYADTKVASDTSAVSNSVQIANLVMITQSNYDALGSYDTDTLYFIT
jgi:hypothetical protein